MVFLLNHPERLRNLLRWKAGKAGVGSLLAFRFWLFAFVYSMPVCSKEEDCVLHGHVVQDLFPVFDTTCQLFRRLDILTQAFFCRTSFLVILGYCSIGPIGLIWSFVLVFLNSSRACPLAKAVMLTILHHFFWFDGWIRFSASGHGLA
jgi:hypothetical protein